MSNEFDIFISFSLTDSDGKHSKSYYYAKRLNSIFNNFLGVKSYFCDKELSQREKTDFQEELMMRVKNCEIFVLILLDYADSVKPYFKSERVQYLNTHQNHGNFIVLGTSEILKRIDKLDVINEIKSNVDFFDLEDMGSFQRCLNLVNTLAFKANKKKKIDKIKVCKRCHKLFHDDNDIGTTCSFHSGKLEYFYKENTVAFTCCNKKQHFDNKNEIIDISPGCCEGSHEFVNFDS